MTRRMRGEREVDEGRDVDKGNIERGERKRDEG